MMMILLLVIDAAGVWLVVSGIIDNSIARHRCR